MRRRLLIPVVVLLALASAAWNTPTIKSTAIIILYADDNFQGRSAEINEDIDDLSTVNFNDQASSLRLRIGYQATFYEDDHGHGEWFTFNCPPPIGLRVSEYCELASIGGQIATGSLCQFRAENSHGCVHWWNDRISSIKNIKPYDPNQPQAKIDEGHD
jgi:hypothetical protein